MTPLKATAKREKIWNSKNFLFQSQEKWIKKNQSRRMDKKKLTYKQTDRYKQIINISYISSAQALFYNEREEKKNNSVVFSINYKMINDHFTSTRSLFTHLICEESKRSCAHNCACDQL